MLISLQLCWVMVGSFARILRNSKAAKAPNQVKEMYQRPIRLKGLSTMSAKPTSPIMLYSPTLEPLAGVDIASQMFRCDPPYQPTSPHFSTNLLP